MYKINQVLLLNVVRAIVATLVMSIALYILSFLLAGLSLLIEYLLALFI